MTGPSDIPGGTIRRFVASDGYPLAFRHFEAAAPKSAIISLHGIQSHSGWYGYSSKQLADAGYSVYFLDRRGSGENGTARGHTPNVERLINDVRQFARFVSHEANMQPTLLGLSWGGKLALVTAARSADLFSKLVLLYPGMCARIQPTWWQRRALRLVSTSPRARKRVRIPGLTESLFTEDPKWQDYIRTDHLALRYASLAFLHASTVLDERIADAATGLVLPTLVMLSGQDRIIDNDATRNLVRHFACDDRTILEYAHAAHTLEFESDRNTIVLDLIAWLEQRNSSQ